MPNVVESNAEIELKLGLELFSQSAYSQALPCLLRAAELGSDQVFDPLGYIYSVGGCGVSVDHAEAVRWYRHGADLGQKICLLNLGLKYEGGLGVTKDPVVAAKIYETAMQQNDVNSQVQLGVMYMDGRGVKRDYSRGIELLMDAERQSRTQLGQGGHALQALFLALGREANGSLRNTDALAEALNLDLPRPTSKDDISFPRCTA